MGYAIIEKEYELACSRTSIEEKLAEAARLFLEYFSFDQSLIYLFDERDGCFRLHAASGVETGRLQEYDEGEGVPGMVRKNGAPVEAFDEQAAAGIDDRGLEGFNCFCAYPLKDGSFYGVLYLKSTSDLRIESSERDMLNAAALTLNNILFCNTLMDGHKKEHADLEELKEKLYNAEKLMALGDMAAVLAHEVRNPVISLGGFASKVRKHLEPDSPSIPYVEKMLSEVSRIEKIIDGVVRFIKDNVVELEFDDANDIIADSLRIFTDDFEENGIDVITDIYEEPLPVMADREQLKIAFDNLITNAIQSMQNGGTLRVTTTRTEQSVVVKISDSGTGIDPGLRGYIFNPFFTTKKLGTGLGLPITNSIVMRHKGMVDVVNNEEGGATFSVILPYAGSRVAS